MNLLIYIKNYILLIIISITFSKFYNIYYHILICKYFKNICNSLLPLFLHRKEQLILTMRWQFWIQFLSKSLFLCRGWWSQGWPYWVWGAFLQRIRCFQLVQRIRLSWLFLSPSSSVQWNEVHLKGFRVLLWEPIRLLNR